ncbi:hypothetical protein HXX76_010019 [Chlamydomonas incerta]|uniref:Uncharacterized protein n=1 Tax=Chlamydomonas incerta TaxID=51695 RepID=A0A835VZ99_CHLIN|nr:hypothetical protein HXX76_010019 [Chlamydomonas incerta]|eukprot:KAG2430496.1 hypothetical protein HXX76_010019 [Chlamydomonas incerta]
MANTNNRAKLASKRTTAEQAISGIDVKGKVAVVTGGSSGIGVETCRALALHGAKVYLGARSAEAGQAVIDGIRRDAGDAGAGLHLEVLVLDLSDLASVRQAAEKVLAAEAAAAGVQIVILNAGVMACPLTYTQDGLELQTGVNHVAHFYLTQLLLPALKAGADGAPARVVAVASSAHSFAPGMPLDDLNWEKRAAAGKYGPWQSYGQSKACNVLFGRELAKRMAAEGRPVLAFSLHPGIIMTALQRHQSGLVKAAIRWMTAPWQKSTAQGAATSIYAATAPELTPAQSGSYLCDCAISPSSKLTSDMAVAAGLWEATEALLARALKGELKHLAPKQEAKEAGGKEEPKAAEGVKEDAKEEAKEAVKEAKAQAKEVAKEAKEAVKEVAKEDVKVKEAAKEAVKEVAKEEVKVKEEVKEAAKEVAKEEATAKEDVKEAVKEVAKAEEEVKEAKEEEKAKEEVKEVAKEEEKAKEEVKEVAKEVKAEVAKEEAKAEAKVEAGKEAVAEAKAAAGKAVAAAAEEKPAAVAAAGTAQ